MPPKSKAQQAYAGMSKTPDRPLTPVNTEEFNEPKQDRAAYMREYMRKKRAAEKSNG